MSREIVLIAHNVRSTHNVGSLLRTCEGIGVSRVYLTGYTPYPKAKDDERLPHIAEKLHRQIHKTALGAEDTLAWKYEANIDKVIEDLKSKNYTICAVEQDNNSVKLPDFIPPSKLAIIVGREVEGIESEVLKKTDIILEIPMFGNKESFNVVQAAAMALYQLTFY